MTLYDIFAPFSSSAVQFHSCLQYDMRDSYVDYLYQQYLALSCDSVHELDICVMTVRPL